MDKFLVCGSEGFIGRNLVEFLSEMDSVRGSTVDFTVPYQTGLAVRDAEYVFICCAKSYNGIVAQENPASMILPNIQMVSNILDSAYRNKVGKVVYISSATVYQPSLERIAEDELDLNINPYDCYMGVGWVKRYCEKLCEFYSKLGLKVVVVRPTNVYGKYDKKDPAKCHVVPAMIMRALRKEDPFIIYGDGSAAKDLIHIDDFVNDLTKIAFNHNTPDPVNICSSWIYSMDHIAEKVCKAVGYSPKFKHVCTNMQQIPIRQLGRAKLNKIVGCHEYLDLDEGLERTIPWFS